MGQCATLGLLAVPVSLAVLVGCDNPRDCGAVQDSPADPLASASGYPLLTGDVTIEVLPPRFSFCPPGFSYPTATGVRVFDPGDQPLAAAWEQVLGRRIHATFHSGTAGWHRVEVDYTPDPRTGRQVTTTAFVAALAFDRSGAPRMELGAHCDFVRRTAQGTWLCDHEVFRGTTRVQSLRSDMRYVVSGNTVWGVSEGARDGTGALTGAHDVARWTDTGSGLLVDAGTGTFDAGREAEALHSMAATTGELVARFNFRLTQLEWTAGPSPSLRVAGETTLPQTANLFVREMSWEPPLIAVSVHDSGPDAGSGVCLYALDAGTASPAGRCLPEVDGKTADGYWSMRRGDVTVDALQGGTFQRVASFPTIQWRSALYVAIPGPALEVISGDPDRPGSVLMIPRVHSGEPVYEGYPMGGRSLPGVERDYFWWSQPDGGTEVVLR